MTTCFDTAAISNFRVIQSSIGSKTTIPNWPTPDLAGLIQALTTWTLSPHTEMSDADLTHPHAAYMKPFRGLCFGTCLSELIPGSNGKYRFVGTQPIHPDHPNAVRYCGNFMVYSFGFWLDTDDDSLIKFLDDLIAVNMASLEYQTAKNHELSKIRKHRYL